jgi:hypothetical protein
MLLAFQLITHNQSNFVFRNKIIVFRSNCTQNTAERATPILKLFHHHTAYMQLLLHLFSFYYTRICLCFPFSFTDEMLFEIELHFLGWFIILREVYNTRNSDIVLNNVGMKIHLMRKSLLVFSN